MSLIKAKDFFIKAGLIFGGVIFALILSEVTLRLVLPKDQKISDNEIVRQDNYLGHILVPGNFGIDEKGFRGYQDFDGFNDFSKYPILVLGDSHTFGIFNQPGAAWPAFLAKNLNIPVYNMGVWGYGPAQYFSLTDQALVLKPRLIVVGFYLGNDLFDAYQYVYSRQGWQEFKDDSFSRESFLPSNYLTEQKVFLGPFRNWLRNELVIYKFLSERTRNFREYLGLSKAKNTGVKDWRTTDQGVSLYFEHPQNTTRFWSASRLKGLDLSTPEISEGLRLTKVFFEKMNQMANEVGSQLAIVYLPTKEAVYENLVGEKTTENIFFKNVLTNEKKIKEELNIFCAEKIISCFDPLSFLQDSLASGHKIFYESTDDHPTALGYEDYAHAMNNFIRKIITDWEDNFFLHEL